MNMMASDLLECERSREVKESGILERRTEHPLESLNCHLQSANGGDICFKEEHMDEQNIEWKLKKTTTSEAEAKSQFTQTDTVNMDGVGFQPAPSIAEYVQNFGLTHFLDTASYNEYGEKVNFFKCSMCPYQTRLKKTLTTHIRTHTGEKPFKCTYCPFRTAQRTHLTMHLRTHTGERPFKCTECSFSSASGSDLKRHHRIHTGEKPYKCEICSYVASQKSYLTVHYRTHTGVKPYKCTLCSFSSARRYHLTTHLRTHTGEKPYKCAVCPFATAKSSHLRRHEKIHAAKKEVDKCS